MTLPSRLREQSLRFARIAGFAMLTQLSVIGFSHLTRGIMISAGVAALETAYRQVFPPVK